MNPTPYRERNAFPFPGTHCVFLFPTPTTDWAISPDPPKRGARFLAVLPNCFFIAIFRFSGVDFFRICCIISVVIYRYYSIGIILLRKVNAYGEELYACNKHSGTGRSAEPLPGCPNPVRFLYPGAGGSDLPGCRLRGQPGEDSPGKASRSRDRNGRGGRQGHQKSLRRRVHL